MPPFENQFIRRKKEEGRNTRLSPSLHLLQLSTMMFIDPPKCLELGLTFVQISAAEQSLMSAAAKLHEFRSFYGSTPLDIAEMWYDLKHHGILTEKDISMTGFKKYMVAHYYLYSYPRNATQTKRIFKACKDYVTGKHLWGMIANIASLLPHRIYWDESLGDPDKSVFVASVDCTDCAIWEKRHHHHTNMDTSLYTKKKQSAGLKYEIVLSITSAKCMSVGGPYKPSIGDLDVFRKSTKTKMLAMPGKKIIADSGYRAKEGTHPEEIGMFSLPNPLDDVELKRFKSRVRARHESFNGRLKCFRILDDKFHGVDLEKHGFAFKAVSVIVQYQMDNGSAIFDA